MHVRQKKYTHGFNHSLESSQDLIYKIRDCINATRSDWIVKVLADATPYMDCDGKEFRLWDIDVRDDCKRDWMVEGKDFSRLACYDATGLPRPYIDHKMSKWSLTK